LPTHAIVSNRSLEERGNQERICNLYTSYYQPTISISIHLEMKSKDYKLTIKHHIVEALVDKLKYETGMSIEDLTEEELEETVNDYLEYTISEGWI
jgi:hypothetical protein